MKWIFCIYNVYTRKSGINWIVSSLKISFEFFWRCVIKRFFRYLSENCQETIEKVSFEKKCIMSSFYPFLSFWYVRYLLVTLPHILFSLFFPETRISSYQAIFLVIFLVTFLCRVCCPLLILRFCFLHYCYVVIAFVFLIFSFLILSISDFPVMLGKIFISAVLGNLFDTHPCFGRRMSHASLVFPHL